MGACIAQWIRLHLPSGSPGFESQVQNIRFFHLCLHICINLSIATSIHVYIYLYLHLSMTTSIHVCSYLILHLSMSTSIYTYIYPCLHLSMSTSIYVYIYLCLHLSMSASIYVYIYVCLHPHMFKNNKLFKYTSASINFTPNLLPFISDRFNEKFKQSQLVGPTSLRSCLGTSPPICLQLNQPQIYSKTNKLSATRWLDYFYNDWSFTTIKFCQSTLKFCRILNQPIKMD